MICLSMLQNITKQFLHDAKQNQLFIITVRSARTDYAKAGCINFGFLKGKQLMFNGLNKPDVGYKI